MVKGLASFALCLLLSTTFVSEATAQSKKNTKSKKPLIHQKWEVGAYFGASQYQGDLQVLGTKDINIGNIGILARYHINDAFAIRPNFILGQLSAADFNEARKYSFSTPLRELSVLGEYEFLGKRRYANIEQGKFKKTFSPYLFAGVGYANLTPKTDYNRNGNISNKTKIDEDDQKREDFKGAIALPIGAGVKMDLSKFWTIGVEAGLRLTMNDYLDGISVSANPDKNDTYVTGGVILSYRIPFMKDTDGDGIADDADACPEIAGPVKSKGCPDKDGDGMGDRFDSCPDVAGLKSMSGCPDSDRDGVADKDDACPDMIGAKELNGCPDTDEDGVADKDDECPSEKGKKEYAGCPTRDTDGDGVEDLLDKCPQQKGAKDNNGCPYIDADNDGVVDKDDLCPDKKGTARFNGCPDTDGDGIEDSKDKCPEVAGVSFNQGCPEIKQEDKKMLEKAVYGVEFETGSSKIKSKSLADLDNVVSVMQKYPEYTMSIDGHTDNVGNAKSNLALSKARAKACYDYFVSKGIQALRMSHNGFGSTVPIDDNKTAAGRAKNRRVEFQLFVK
jgi:OmpA-OmpF porin, OOP family